MDPRNYHYTRYFSTIFEDRTGIPFSQCIWKEILTGIAHVNKPHCKVDNKGRYSEYMTFTIQGVLITFVFDGHTHKLITCIKETHVKNYKKLQEID